MRPRTLSSSSDRDAHDCPVPRTDMAVVVKYLCVGHLSHATHEDAHQSVHLCPIKSRVDFSIANSPLWRYLPTVTRNVRGTSSVFCLSRGGYSRRDTASSIEQNYDKILVKVSRCQGQGFL
jgi:hypothetical protein